VLLCSVGFCVLLIFCTLSCAARYCRRGVLAAFANPEYSQVLKYLARVC
jgi:hypothetical protein